MTARFSSSNPLHTQGGDTHEPQAWMRITGATLLAAVLGLTTPALAAHGSKSASDLRTGYNALLAEHVFLAAAATSAALGGRQAEFEAAAAALDGNSQDIATSIGSVYGAGQGGGRPHRLHGRLRRLP